MKRNYSAIFALAAVVLLTVTGCPKTKPPEKVPDNIAQMAGSTGWRSWTVFSTTTPDTKHIVYGDAFRLKQAGNKVFLRPLTSLRGRWQMAAGDQIELKIVGDANPMLCGEVSVPNHDAGMETHYMLIEWVGADFIDITFEVEDDEIPDQCTSRGTHGGRAHAQN